jgi:hypothetical protein
MNRAAWLTGNNDYVGQLRQPDGLINVWRPPQPGLREEPKRIWYLTAILRATSNIAHLPLVYNHFS